MSKEQVNVYLIRRLIPRTRADECPLDVYRVINDINKNRKDDEETMEDLEDAFLQLGSPAAA